MPHVDDILAFVAGSGEPEVDDVLIAALPTADAAAKHVIADQLIERNRLPGQIALVLEFHHLDAALQERLVGQADELSRALRLAIDRSPRGGARNALRIIERSLSPRLAYLVADQLRRGDEAVCRDASRCLRTLAREMAERRSTRYRRGVDAARKEDLIGAVFDALRCYSRHKCGDVLDALMYLAPESLADIAPLLGNADALIVRALEERLAEPADPHVRISLPGFARFAALTPAVVRGIASVAEDGDFELLLADVASLANPQLKNAMRKLASPERLWPTTEQLSKLPSPTLRALVKWADILPFDTTDRVQALRDVSKLGDATVRLAALRALLRMSSDQSGHTDDALEQAIGDFCRDANEWIARTALWAMIRRSGDYSIRLLSQLTGSPHESIRALAAKHIAPTGFSRYWSQWPQMQDSQRIATGRALIKIDPMFHQKLAEKLLIEQRDPRMRALNMIAELGQGCFFEEGLIRLSEDEDVYIVSASARAMGTATGDAIVSRLEVLLRHADPRVRANAVEALAQLQSHDHITRLLEMAHEDHHRPRSSAIAVLMELRTSEALESLARMLHDGRESHRMSGLWLVEAMGLIEVSRSVAEMAISDANRAVKQRADQVIGQLMHSLAGAA